jgi:GxxExxY protein
MAYQQDQLTAKIIQCIIKVHKTLGPGFLENIYRRALLLELQKQKLFVDMEKEVIIYYEQSEVGRHRMDLVVENRVIVELKTVEALSRAHYAQARAYMKATTLPVAILINFSKERADFRRIEAEKMKIK